MRVKVEGVCVFYDQAGGQCRWSNIPYTIGKHVEEVDKKGFSPTDSEKPPSFRMLSSKGPSDLSRYDEDLRASSRRAFLCQARGFGGIIYTLSTQEIQSGCSQYQKGPQRTARR